MTHYFRYPSASASTAYTSTLALNPAFVAIQEENIRPVQRAIETDDGTIWAFQVSANRRQTYSVSVKHLNASSGEGSHGYTALKNFFDTNSTAGANYMINSFDLFLSDESTIAIEVRLVTHEWSFEEKYTNRYSGRFDLAKVL